MSNTGVPLIRLCRWDNRLRVDGNLGWFYPVNQIFFRSELFGKHTNKQKSFRVWIICCSQQSDWWLMGDHHDSPWARHMSFRKTLWRLSLLRSWPATVHVCPSSLAVVFSTDSNTLLQSRRHTVLDDDGSPPPIMKSRNILNSDPCRG